MRILSATRTDHQAGGGKATAAALTSGYHLAFLIGAALVAAAIVVAATVLRAEGAAHTATTSVEPDYFEAA